MRPIYPLDMADEELAAAIERSSEEIAQQEAINVGESAGCIAVTDLAD